MSLSSTTIPTDPHVLLFGHYFFSSEIISFTLIGIAIGTWIVTFITITIGICMMVNGEKWKVPLLSYRLINCSQISPVEVVVEQETAPPPLTQTPQPPPVTVAAQVPKSISQAPTPKPPQAATPQVPKSQSQAPTPRPQAPTPQPSNRKSVINTDRTAPSGGLTDRTAPSASTALAPRTPAPSTTASHRRL